MIKNIDRFDLFSLGLIVLVLLFSSLKYLGVPVFVDNFYHLCIAKEFLSSGGWIGWNWWEYVPYGKPNIYAPLYHFLLTLFLSLGIGELTAMKISEIILAPIFFITTWVVFRVLAGSRVTFFILLILFSFFPFYASLSVNIPATFALIFGLLSWYFFKQEKFISSSLMLIFAAYSQFWVGIIFLVSYIYLVLTNPCYRKLSLKVVIIGIVLILPFVFHLLSHISFITLRVLGEKYLTRYNIFILGLGFSGLLLFLRNNELIYSLAKGYLLGSIIVFLFYPYRFFSAQGVIGLVIFTALVIDRVTHLIRERYRGIFLIGIVLYFVVFNGEIFYNKSKGKIQFNFLKTTLMELVTGDWVNFLYFRPIYFSRFYQPLVKIIKKHSYANEPIVSNSSLAARILSSLSGRPTVNSLLPETKKDYTIAYKYGKVIVWLKLPQEKIIPSFSFKKQKVFENEIAYVFINLQYSPMLRIIPAVIPFKAAGIIFMFFLILFYIDVKRNSKVLNRKIGV